MPGIFHKLDGQWRIERLPVPRGWLHLSPVRFESFETRKPIEGIGACLLMRIDEGRQWAAIAPENLRLFHNGQPIPAGLRILAHRDSLAITGAESVFFSTEEAACIETYADSDALSCPRCRVEILAGQPVVRCPACGVVHHEFGDRNCWTYGTTCALCAQPTALDTGLRWSPDEL